MLNPPPKNGSPAVTSPALPSNPSVLPGEHLHALRARLRGDLFLPEEPGWDSARQGWQLLVDQRPAAIVFAADVDDVVTTVRAARKLGLQVAPQSTGHGAGVLGPLGDTILLRTSRLDGVAIDPETERARVGAGAVWREVVAAAAPYGLAAVAGMAPTVGVVGFALGGGLGWLARSHGLAANSVVGLEVVDAQGRVLHVDEARNADLFWAARGGFAPVVVTAVELQLHPIADLQAGSLLWPVERAADVAHAWRAWIGTVPESVTSLARVLRYPPIPDIPEMLRGKSFVAIEAAIQADAATAAALLQPLRALEPALDSVRPIAPSELGSVHGDPERPAPALGEAIVLAEIDAASIDALLDAALAPSSAALVSIELRHLGGAAAPGRASAGGAVSAVEGEGLLFAVGIVPGPDALGPVRAAAAAVVERLAPFAAPTVVKNFVERPVAASALYPPATLERLRRVASAWDPERIIRPGHPLD